MYSAAAGMAAQQQRMDAAANDLANTSTTGYKHVRVAFRDLAYTASGPGGTGDVLIGGGAAATTLGRSLGQGALQLTQSPLDVALQGPGLLRRPRPGRQRGDDPRRPARHRQPQPPDHRERPAARPPDHRPAGDRQGEHPCRARRDASRSAARRLGALRIVTVPNASALQGGQDNTFRATAASAVPPRAAPRTTVVTQGALEGSNVDLGDAMVDMMEAQRGFELASKAIQYQDQLMEIANGIKR